MQVGESQQTLAPAAARISVRPLLHALWRYRVPFAGLSAIILACLGEALMRQPAGDTTGAAALGTHLMQVAVLLVGLVAWVHSGPRLGGRAPDAAPAPEAPRLPVRAAARPVAADDGAPAAVPSGRLAAALAAYRRARARLGWAGTVLGLLIVAALTVWCYLLLRQDYSAPLAPWLWLASLIVLAGTFVGARAPGAPGLVPRDPGEPADPPITRREWLILGAILLVAVVVRLWNLEMIPAGPYTDEADRAMDALRLNNGELVNHAPFVFFGTGWWGVPSLYFWLVAQSLKVFGATLAGARMIHAIAGILTVWVTYLLGRAVWSPRVGLVAAALLAVSDFAIQFSRTAGESTITLFTWAVCFYYLYRALQTRRALYYVLSGIAGGFSLYGYASGKLLPVFLALAAGYILLRWGRTGIRRYLPGLALLALAAALTYAPNGLYGLSHTDAFLMRYNGVSIFNHAQEYGVIYGTNNWGTIIAQQFGLTFRAFDVGQERGPFYPTGQPILPIAWAALWVLGCAYLIWRAGDVRFALLGVWVVGGLAGAALTNDTPTLQRVATMVPALALVPAVFLDRIGRGIPTVSWRRPRLQPFRLVRGAFTALLVILVIAFGIQTLYFYFVPYTAAAHYDWYGLAGRYAGTLDPTRDRIYQLDVPEFYWGMSAAYLEAKGVQGSDLGNAGDALPLTDNGDLNAHFLVFPTNDPYLSVLKTYYPGGKTSNLTHASGAHFATIYEVDTAQFDAQRQEVAQYGPAAGPIFERPEPRLGTLGPDGVPPLAPPRGLAYPLDAAWQGGLAVPAYGTYILSLLAPGGATLVIDGRPVLAAPAGSGSVVEARVVLAEGLHTVRLAGTLPSPQSPIALRWRADAGVPVPIGRPYLWNGPLGTLHGQTFGGPGPAGWLTDPVLPPAAGAPAAEMRNGVLAWRGVDDALHSGAPAHGVWTGTLAIPTAGTYTLDLATDAAATVWVDGAQVGRRGPGASGLPAALPLSAGNHALQVRVQSRPGPSVLELYWQPPGGARELLPPTALAPADGGAWRADERPGVAAPDPALIGAAPAPQPLAPVRQIAGAWKEARGVAVLPDGRVVVGDTGHSRVVVYAPGGDVQAAWGSPGTGDGRFGTIADVAALPDGTIAVLDTGNHDIQIFDATGKLLAHLSAGQVQVSQAMGLAAGPDGTLYVADTSDSRVVHLSRDGRMLGIFQTGINGVAALDQPTDVAVLPDGSVYAVDLRKRIVHVNTAGRIDQEWSVPIGLARGGSHLAVWNGQIVISNPDRNTLAFLDPGSNSLHEMAQTPAAPIEMSVPIGVAGGPDRQIYVLDSDNSRVLVLRAP